jgi:hypothetical protein
MLASDAAPLPAADLWRTRVEPLLERHCFKCHGGVQQKADLDLRSLDTILRGGENGPAIMPGRPERSHLYQFVQPGADPHMPLDEKKQLSGEDIALLKTWIQKLPPVERLLGACSATNAAWAGEYVARFKESQKPVWTPSAKLTPRGIIDRFIALGWKERNVKPSSLCDDRTFIRRVYLDLAGRIPTPTEAGAFLADRRRDRRVRLVETLLAGDDFARHLRDIFDVVLMERRLEPMENQRRDRQTPRRDDRWFRFLEDAFRANRPWNEIVRDLILARPAEETGRGAVWFLYERNNNYQAMAEAVAPVAFGVQFKCAQCHNDPLAWEIEQRHYWGLVAAFNRSKNVDTAEGIGVAESAIGGFINFQNLRKESQPAQLAFLNGKSVEEKRPAEGEKETDAPDFYLVPPPKEKEKPARPSVPKFSRRVALAEALTRENPMLARAFVNRMWALLMGRGLVHPVDQMTARNRPSHPDLLDWLTQDFERSGYDIKDLIRNLVLTRVYQLDSRPRGNSAPPPEAFARGPEKPLSAEQLYGSFLVATGSAADDAGKIAGHDENEIRNAFAARFPDLFAPDYNASLQQATFLSNSPLIDELLGKRGTNTTARLVALASPGERAIEAFRIVLGREPDRQERERAAGFLSGKAPETGTRGLLWALLTSTEFQMNH